MKLLALLCLLALPGCAASRPKVTVEIHADKVQSEPSYTVSISM